MDEKKVLIKEYIDKEECEYICDDKVFDCIHCSCFEDCCAIAEIRCDDELNDTFAKSINYGGYDNAEEFWEQIFD